MTTIDIGSKGDVDRQIDQSSLGIAGAQHQQLTRNASDDNAVVSAWIAPMTTEGGAR